MYIACNEAYPSSSELQYACSTGCNVTTIDSLFPDRGVIYSEISLENSNSSSMSSDSAPLEQFASLVNSLFNGFFDGFSFGPDMDKLTEHASQMSQLLQPAKSSMITYIFDDVSWFVCVCVREREREKERERERERERN